MAALSTLFDPILPVFTIMVIGFLMGRGGRMSQEQARHINAFAMSVLLPLMLIGFMSEMDLGQFQLTPILLYGATEIVVFAAGFCVARYLFRAGGRESVLLAFSGVFANNAYYVLPISVLLYGAENALPVTAVVALDATFTFGSIVIMLQIIELGQARPLVVLKRLAVSPILQGIAVGVAIAVSGVTLPAPIKTFLSFNAVAAAPVGLFALGVVLSATKFSTDRVVVTFSAVQLIIFPSLVWLAMHLWTTDTSAFDLYVLASAGPAGAMGFSLALLHGVRSDRIAQVMVWTSLLSLITLALLT